MKTSVIFTTYNSPDWMEKVLWGFFNQTVSDFEIIIADDGSGDETRARINQLATKSPISLRHIWQPDQGFQKSRILNASSQFSRHLGPANLTDRNNNWTQIMESITRLQSPVDVESEYARTFRSVFMDSAELAQAEKVTQEPSGNFEDNDLARRLRFAARVMPFYRAAGATSQIYSIEWGDFDTHANQRGNADQGGRMGQDAQLAQLAKALVAFDQSLQTIGLGNQVAVLVTSEFGRTLDPAAGLGSDHAWGSHWMVMGNMVGGSRIYGNSFPRLILGGVDDAHDGRRGYWVPQLSSDQVAADLLLWLGLSKERLTQVLPNLANFSQKTVGFMNA